jgi:hypothetical protein
MLKAIKRWFTDDAQSVRKWRKFTPYGIALFGVSAIMAVWLTLQTQYEPSPLGYWGLVFCSITIAVVLCLGQARAIRVKRVS